VLVPCSDGRHAAAAQRAHEPEIGHFVGGVGAAAAAAAASAAAAAAATTVTKPELRVAVAAGRPHLAVGRHGERVRLAGRGGDDAARQDGLDGLLCLCFVVGRRVVFLLCFLTNKEVDSNGRQPIT
jgi:hypothetical protein